MEKRLIDANKLIQDVEKLLYKGNPIVAFLQKQVDKQPTIDAVPIVWCKDCKWKADTICESWCDFHEFTILSDDDFCSYGERSE